MLLCGHTAWFKVDRVLDIVVIPICILLRSSPDMLNLRSLRGCLLIAICSKFSWHHTHWEDHLADFLQSLQTPLVNPDHGSLCHSQRSLGVRSPQGLVNAPLTCDPGRYFNYDSLAPHFPGYCTGSIIAVPIPSSGTPRCASGGLQPYLSPRGSGIRP